MIARSLNVNGRALPHQQRRHPHKPANTLYRRRSVGGRVSHVSRRRAPSRTPVEDRRGPVAETHLLCDGSTPLDVRRALEFLRLVALPSVVPSLPRVLPRAELAGGEPDLERDRGLHVQPQESPLQLGGRPVLLHLILPIAVDQAEDLRDIAVDVGVAVRAFGVDSRRAELGLIPEDIGAAEQPQMLVSHGEPLNTTDHIKQPPRVSACPVQPNSRRTPCWRQNRSNFSIWSRSPPIIIGWVAYTASWRPAEIAFTKAANWLPGGPSSAYTAGTGQPILWTRPITMSRMRVNSKLPSPRR